jgi:threonyl-tRNA synthetase
VAVLPISEKFNDYSQKVVDFLKNAEIRTSFDERAEKIGKKIRESEMQKTRFMLIIGEKEESEQKVSVRERGKGDIGSMSWEEFKKLVDQRVKENFNQ